MVRMTYAAAARLALAEEMRRDPLVWALGEDLGPEGGVGGQYKGLQAEFGKHRIVDTPISENTIMGSAVGAALVGTRPVVELRYCDFGMCAADEIVNQAAKIRYMLGGQARAPLVIRQTIGMRGGVAAQHSQSTEGWWVHIPGLVVITPGTPADNRALLKAAIRCNDPVVYMEHKDMWTVEGEVPEAEEVAEIGKAVTRRTGRDLTIVAWSGTVLSSLAAADDLAKDGIDAEVIDLRTLYPWDRDAVCASVRRTGRLLVVHEACRVMGFGAEVAAEVTEQCFSALKAPPARLGTPRIPVPYAEPIEELCRIRPPRIAEAARALIGSGGGGVSAARKRPTRAKSR